MKRTKAEVDAAWAVLLQFIESGWEPFPLKHYQALTPAGKPGGGKIPKDNGWAINDYRQFDFAKWMYGGGNVGFRLMANQVVIDIDPRNNGWASLEALYFDVPELEAMMKRAPRTYSGRGDGGYHHYFTKDPDVRTRITRPAFPGIDFKRGVGLVVAPGSLHPTTGLPYLFDTAGTPISQAEPIPLVLQELLKEVPKETNGRRGNGGLITPQELATLLSVLPPEDYGRGGKYSDEWLDIAMACHDGTQGDGEPEWQAWNARDNQYGEDYQMRNHLRWLSFDVRKSGAHRTVLTLLRAVSREGRKDLVAGIGKWNNVADDFDDDPFGEGIPPKSTDIDWNL